MICFYLSDDKFLKRKIRHLSKTPIHHVSDALRLVAIYRWFSFALPQRNNWTSYSDWGSPFTLCLTSKIEKILAQHTKYASLRLKVATAWIPCCQSGSNPLFSVLLRLKIMANNPQGGRHGWQGPSRPGPCLDFGFQHTLIWILG